MAAGATVMGVCLGGSANYHGQTVTSVKLGEGRAVIVEDISRSIRVVQKATLLLFTSVFIWQLFGFYR